MFGIFKKKKTILVMPLEGKVIDITEVPDPVFSQKMLGDGFAIIPNNGKVVSPINGKIVQRFPTNHAIGLETENGLEVLIHFGINTVTLKGEGFKNLVDVGDIVKAGQPILEVDLEFLKEKEISPITPIIFTKMDQISSFEATFGDLKVSEECCKIVLK